MIRSGTTAAYRADLIAVRDGTFYYILKDRSGAQNVRITREEFLDKLSTMSYSMPLVFDIQDANLYAREIVERIGGRPPQPFVPFSMPGERVHSPLFEMSFVVEAAVPREERQPSEVYGEFIDERD